MFVCPPNDQSAIQCLPVCLLFCWYVCLFVRLLISLSGYSCAIHLSVRILVYFSVCLLICGHVWLFTHAPVYLSVPMSVASFVTVTFKMDAFNVSAATISLSV